MVESDLLEEAYDERDNASETVARLSGVLTHHSDEMSDKAVSRVNDILEEQGYGHIAVE